MKAAADAESAFSWAVRVFRQRPKNKYLCLRPLAAASGSAFKDLNALV